VTDRDDLPVERLERFLAERIPNLRGPIAVAPFPGGQSNPTYRITTPGASLVLRRKPTGQTLATAHAIDREFRVISALHPLGLPVAKPLLLCEDPDPIGAPFYLMEFVDGRIFWDPRLPELSPDERRSVYIEMVEVLAAIHAVDLTTAGLADLAKPSDYFQRQYRRWSTQYLEQPHRDLPSMRFLIEWLAVNRPVASDRVVLIHGDYRLDNLIFDRDRLRIRAVIDWELATLGDPLADLSYQCTLWRLPAAMFAGLGGADRATLGIPTEEEYRDRYLERAGLPPVVGWERYIVFNLFRFAAILDGIGRRVERGTAASGRAAELAAWAGPVAEEAAALAKRLG
jgi:aminoglycoside phosphotransferase (APT) family kinase protein